MLLPDQKQTFSELLQALALRLGRNVLLLKASRDRQLFLKFVSISRLWTVPTLSKLTPVASKARAPEHEREVPKVDLNRTAYQYSLQILAEQIAIYNRAMMGFDSRV